MVSLSKGKYKIIVENISYGILGKICHEFTHCVQYKEERLSYSDNIVIWKGKEFITIEELNEITNFDEYKKLHWEEEAYKMQEILPALFLKSDYIEELKKNQI